MSLEIAAALLQSMGNPTGAVMREETVAAIADRRGERAFDLCEV